MHTRVLVEVEISAIVEDVLQLCPRGKVFHHEHTPLGSTSQHPRQVLAVASIPPKTKGAFCSTSPGPAASRGPLSSTAWVCQEDEMHLQTRVVLQILEEVRKNLGRGFLVASQGSGCRTRLSLRGVKLLWHWGCFSGTNEHLHKKLTVLRTWVSKNVTCPFILSASSLQLWDFPAASVVMNHICVN